jgi:polyisoprenyl-phosphate glycosyltransferase
LQKLSVIIPIYNEETLLIELHKRLSAVLSMLPLDAEIICIDDGSTDGSLHVLKALAFADSRVKYISLTRNFGHQIALQAGLEYCQGDLVITMDGDLQDPPELIPAFIEAHQNTGASVVYGRRRIRKNESVFKKGFAALFYRLLKRISTINIPLDTGDFRLVTAEVVKNLSKMPEPNKFLRGQVAWLGHQQTFLTYDRESRGSGKSNFTYRKMIRFGLDGVTGFSNFPLKLATLSGIGISFFSFFLILYILYTKLVLHAVVSGWASIMVTILFMGGIQLFSIGVIGEYISRINDSVRNRPLYIVSDSNINPAAS